jgi:hypothetical protein
MSDEVKKPHLFVTCPNSDGVKWWAGPVSDGGHKLMEAVGHLIEEDMRALLAGENENGAFSIEFEIEQMTDEEIQNLGDV